jgi:hypothetical protein
VIVFGEYAYGEKPPWQQLDTDPCATTVTSGELAETLRPYLWTVLQRASVFASVDL